MRNTSGCGQIHWPSEKLKSKCCQQDSEIPQSFALAPKATPEVKDFSGQKDSDQCQEVGPMDLDVTLRKQLLILNRKMDDLSMLVSSNFDSMSVQLLKIRDQCKTQQPCPSCAGRLSLQSDITPVTPSRPRRAVRVMEGPEPLESSQTDFETGATAAEEQRKNRGNSRDSSMSSISSVGDGLDTFMNRFGAETTLLQVVWAFLEDPESSNQAWWYTRFRSFLIVVSVGATLMMTVEPSPLPVGFLLTFNMLVDCMFMLETSLRYIVCRSTLLFFGNPNNVCDVMSSVLPLAANLPCLTDGVLSCTEEGSAIAMMRIHVPVLRLLKGLRHFTQFHLFVSLVMDIHEALSVLLLLLGVIVLSCASIVYSVEPRDNVETLPIAMYFIITTISTVGYGDYSPSTTIGYAVVSIVILLSILFMALPLGIIGNAFTSIWQDRDKTLLTMRTQDRLAQWGYTASDLKMLLKHFDSNGDGQLDLPEFVAMIREMRIGIQHYRIVTLFELFDRDHSGQIDAKELCRVLFPSSYHELFDELGRDGCRRPSRGGFAGRLSELFRRAGTNSTVNLASSR